MRNDIDNQIAAELTKSISRDIEVPERIIRLPEVVALTGLSRSSVYIHIAEGALPRPVSIGSRSVGWPLIEIRAVNAARIAGKSDDEIRDLVARLVAERKGSV